MKRSIGLTVILCVSFAAMMAGIYVANNWQSAKKPDLTEFHGTYLQTQRPINEFSLVGIDNKPYTNESLKGHWTLFFFGFTNCGYVCPTTMAELSKVFNQLKEQGVGNLPQVVMISIDPQRDSLDKLGQYVRAFNPDFFGARGEEAQIKAMTTEMGVAYYKVMNEKGQDPTHYDMQHSGAVMLLNPQGNLQAFFTSPHTADSMVEDLKKLL